MSAGTLVLGVLNGLSIGLLGNCADTVHKIERRFEIGEKKTLCHVVLFHDLPVRQLFCVRQQGLTRKRRHASAAWNAMFGS